MNYEIVELEEFSGNRAGVYSIIVGEEDLTLFDHFVNENITKYRTELKEMSNRLVEIGSRLGARENFFKHNEGKPGDGVCALYDVPNSELRLFCIRYGNVAIILGGGGPKPTEVQAWQDDEKLKLEAELIIRISKYIMKRLQTGEIQWSKDGSQLLGNLKFSDNEE